MRDGPAGTKESERTQIGDFNERNNLAGCSRVCGVTRVPVPAAQIFKETTSYFEICPNLPIFSPSRLWPPYIFLFLSLYFTTLFLEKKPDPRVLDLAICYLLGRRLHLSRLEKIILNPLFISFIHMQYYFESISVFSCFMAEQSTCLVQSVRVLHLWAKHE